MNRLRIAGREPFLRPSDFPPRPIRAEVLHSTPFTQEYSVDGGVLDGVSFRQEWSLEEPPWQQCKCVRISISKSWAMCPIIFEVHIVMTQRHFLTMSLVLTMA